MANTVLVQALLQFFNAANIVTQFNFSGTSFAVSGDHFTQNTWTVPTTAGGTAIPLGGVATPGGYMIVKNNDATNYVQIMAATSGTPLIRIGPGEIAVFRLDAGATAPAAVSHTATCEITYIILDA